jgi:hypothetical protein
MPYQGKFVHLLGDLLEIPHVVDREERIIQQILVMMFLYPLPDISRAPGLPELPVASSVDGCGAPASRKRVHNMKSAI